MTIQKHPWEFLWVNEKLNLSKKSNSFLRAFAEACVRADEENYAILQPALRELMKKYPVKIKELNMIPLQEEQNAKDSGPAEQDGGKDDQASKAQP